MNENKDVSKRLVNGGFRKNQVDLQLIILTDSGIKHFRSFSERLIILPLEWGPNN